VSGAGWKDLWEEYQQAYRAVDPTRHRGWFEAVGMSGLSILACGLPGLARARWVGRLGYEPDEAGFPVVVLPVWAGRTNEIDGLIDLAAWVPKSGEMRLRAGNGWALGELAAALAGDERPLRVQDGVESWWRAAIEIAPDDLAVLRQTGLRPCPPGIVIVDWSRAWQELGDLEQVVAESVELGERLDKALRPPPVRRPKIGIDLATAERAA